MNQISKKQIKYRSGYKHQLAEDHDQFIPILGYQILEDFFSILPNGALKVKKGYAWDGPSGPAIATKTFMRGSLVHDVLYQCMRNGLLPINLRDDADNILYLICIEDGMWPVRAWWVLKGVRIGAGPAADPKNKKEVLTAP